MENIKLDISNNDWPFKFYAGQKVIFIVDAYNCGNRKIAKVGETGVLQNSYCDWNGHVRVLIDGHKRVINTSIGWMMPV